MRVSRVIQVLVSVAIILGGAWFIMFQMPGKSYFVPVLPLTEEQKLLREALRKDINKLSHEIGDQNVRKKYENLCAATDFIEESFMKVGYKVYRQGYEVYLIGL